MLTDPETVGIAAAAVDDAVIAAWPVEREYRQSACRVFEHSVEQDRGAHGRFSFPRSRSTAASASC
jgi:hypothetical protein